ncbi:MAG: RidA family protein [Actinomycetes bacterium]
MDRQLFTKEGAANTLLYSSAARYGDLVFTAGVVGVDVAGVQAEGISAQVEVALDNLCASLALAGAGLETVLKVNTYLVNFDDFAEYNSVYQRRFAGLALPARTTVEVSRLAPGLLVEIEAVAHSRVRTD